MTFDLSAVSDSLIGLDEERVERWHRSGTRSAGPRTTPTFTPNFTGLAPDAVRQEAGPQLQHLPVPHRTRPRPRGDFLASRKYSGSAEGSPTRFLPLALDLFFLLFAYSQTSYAEELEAMSVALRVFHTNPIVRSAPAAAVPWELSLTTERRSYDELSRCGSRPPHRSGCHRCTARRSCSSRVTPARRAAAGHLVALGGRRPGVRCRGPAFPIVFGTSRDGSYQVLTACHCRSPSPAPVAAGQAAVLLAPGPRRHRRLGPRSTCCPPAADPKWTWTWLVPRARSSTRHQARPRPAAAGAAPAGPPPRAGPLPVARRQRRARRCTQRRGAPQHRGAGRSPGGRADADRGGGVHRERSGLPRRRGPRCWPDRSRSQRSRLAATWRS